MKYIHLAVCAAVIIVGYLVIKKMQSDRKNYGGLTTQCERACFSSEYYAACMNHCLQDGHADFMGTGNEYDVLGVRQVDDLDRGYGYDTPQSTTGDALGDTEGERQPIEPMNQKFGLRGDTPGR
jgi:hypothetical protein